MLQGRDPASIVALADLVTQEAARSAMLFFLARSGNRPTAQMGLLAGLLLSVGRHWVKVDPQQEAYLKSLARRCQPPQRGMTEKNRATLRQFKDPDVVDRLLELPRQIHAELRRRKNLSRSQMRRLALALAVQLLLDAPIRRQNLTRLELGRHLVRAGTGSKAGWHLYLPAEDVKNDQAMEFPLRRDTAGLLEFYLEKVRPSMVVPGCTRLFVGRDRNGRNANAFSTQLRVFLGREIGVRLSTHQFRHLAGFLYLSKVPGGHEVVRALLGHRKLATTVQFYAGMETEAAARAYDAAVLGGGEGGMTKSSGPCPRSALVPNRDPERRGLPLAQWPATDRRIWLAAQEAGGPLDDPGRAAHWAPATLSKLAGTYGRYLGWMERCGELDPAGSAATLITEARVKAHLAIARARSAPLTVLSIIADLRLFARAVAPEVDWAWLGRMEAAARQRARPVRDQRARLRLVRELVDLGEALMAEADAGQLTPLQRLLAYRDGLMIALLPLAPLRLRNFAGLRLGHELVRRGDRWWVEVPATQTKYHRPSSARFPSGCGRGCDAIWTRSDLP